jgi:enterochelin esterase-like enzyme
MFARKCVNLNKNALMKLLWILFLVFISLLSCQPPRLVTPDLTLGKGRVERIEVFKSKFVEARNLDVWLPENYSEKERYAVLYMHDGQMLFDATKTWNKQEWRVDEVMQELINSGTIRKTIVVGIWNTNMRRSEYFPQKPFENLPKVFLDQLSAQINTGENPRYRDPVQSDAYLRFIVKELKPFIDKQYATHSDQKNTFIAGSSMGGLISMYALFKYPEVFSGAACLSTHWIGIYDTLNNPIPQSFFNYLSENRSKIKEHKLYFDFGTETLDRFYEPYQLQVDSLFKNPNSPLPNYLSLKFEGENHSERAWAKRLATPLKFLLDKSEP